MKINLQRTEEMKQLRFVEGWSNSDIGKKYGITRERVRQIIGNTGKNFRRKWTEKLIPFIDLTAETSIKIFQACRKCGGNSGESTVTPLGQKTIYPQLNLDRSTKNKLHTF